MMYSVIDAAFQAVAGAQLEIAVFIVAVCAHVFLFRKRPMANEASKGKGKQFKHFEGSEKTGKDADAAGRLTQKAKLSLQAAVANPDLKVAVRDLAALAGQQTGETPSFAFSGALQQLAARAVAQSALPALLEDLQANKAFAPWSLEVIITECARQGNAAGLAAATEMSKATGVQPTAVGYAALMRASGTSGEALRWFNEATGRGMEPDTAARVVLLKRLGGDKRHEDMLRAFRACATKPACLYNAVIDAMVDAKDMKTSQKLAQEAVDAGVADVITSNTIIKAHLHSGSVLRARAALASMRASGLEPNVVTFNEFLDAAVTGAAGSLPWAVVDEMAAAGLKPNAVTCSILLKTVQKNSRAGDVQRIADMLASLEQGEMDEVLLSSGLEAGIRSGQVEFLKSQLQRHRGAKRIVIKGAPAFGSIIRANGYIGNIDGVWETWREMRARRVVPTSITLGCMIEALVSNAGPDAGYKMIQEAANDEETRPLLNAIIYCSVMKGFSHQKNFDRMWEVYQEVLTAEFKCSIVTYNTLVDACARCGEMGKLPELLQNMEKHGIKPNVVTYGAIIKGYCQENKVDQALALLEDMKRTTPFKPDEIAYNTVLDGCARNALYERGLAVLQDMESSDVAPTNFTLSVLVKLCHRARRLESAFEMVKSVSERYNIRPNMHVYNNLMFACVGHGQLPRALEVLKGAVAEKARPDIRTYTIALRGCVSARLPKDAVALLRAAFGLEGAHAVFAGANGHLAKLQGGLPSEIISEVLEGVAHSCGERELAVHVLRELQSLRTVRLEPGLAMRLTGAGHRRM